jgi:hypothetical protein
VWQVVNQSLAERAKHITVEGIEDGDNVLPCGASGYFGPCSIKSLSRLLQHVRLERLIGGGELFIENTNGVFGA